MRHALTTPPLLILCALLFLFGCGSATTTAAPAANDDEPVVIAVPEAEARPSKKGNASAYPHGPQNAGGSPGASPRFELSERGLRVDDIMLSHNPTVGEVQAIIGRTNRVHDLSNTIHSYDDLGLALYQRPGTQTVLELTMYYDWIDAEFMPNSLYSGSLNIGGVDIHNGTRLSQLRSWLDRFNTEYDGSPVFGTYTQVNSSIALYIDVANDSITQVSIDFPH